MLLRLLPLLGLVHLVLSQRGPSYDIEDIDADSAFLTIISLRPPLQRMEENNTTDVDSDDTQELMEQMGQPIPDRRPDGGRPFPRPGRPGRGRRPGPPRPRPNGPPGREDRCGQWGDWEKVKCWWPNQPLSSLPSSCTSVPTKKNWPEYLKKFVISKATERYNMIVDEYNRRGAPPKCGFCSRSFECRTRNETEGRQSPFCPLKEVRPLFESCDDSKACVISQEKGGCPPPMFLGKDRVRRLRDMVRRGDHKGVAAEFAKMRQMDEPADGNQRVKRQIDFEEGEGDFDGENDIGAMFDEGRQKNGNQESKKDKRGPRRGGRGEFMMDQPQQPYGGIPYGPRMQGPQQGGFHGGPDRRGPGGRDFPFPPESRFGPQNFPNAPDRRGDSFPSRGGPGSFGSRRPQGQGFGPDQDFPFGPGGPNFGPERRGPRGDFGPQQDFPFGPFNDFSNGPNRPDSYDRRGPAPRRGPFGPRRDFPFGPDFPPRRDSRDSFAPRGVPRFGPGFGSRRDYPFGPRNDFPFGPDRRGRDFPVPAERFGPRDSFVPRSGPGFGPEQDFPFFRRAPSFGPERRGPPRGDFGPRDDAPSFPSPRPLPPFGPRRGPDGFPGSFPPMGGPSPFGRPFFPPMGPPMGNQQPQMPSPSNNSSEFMRFANFDFSFNEEDRENGVAGPEGRQILAEMLHGTSCASVGDQCLCCCGHFIPNVETGACEDLRRLLPGIDIIFEKFDKEQTAEEIPSPPQDVRSSKKESMNRKFSQMKKMFKGQQMNNF